MKKIVFAILTGMALPVFVVSAQTQTQPEIQATTEAQPKPKSNTIEELKLKLNEDGSHYLKWTFLNQVWLRYNDSNPGTTVLGDAAKQTFDIGLRRTRIQFYGQLTDHVFFYTQFGQNNFNFLSGQNATNSGNRKFQVFFHDALGEYKVWKDNDKLKLGGGLTIANGLSRFSQPSIGSIMTLDVPVFAQATVDQTDEFSRKLSVYARGQVGKFDYRVVLSDPFPVTSNGAAAPAIGPNATFAQTGHHKQYQGFFMWNFFDKETNTTPYMTGTYLGKKKIFNLEAGFITQKNAMWTSNDGGITTDYQNMKLWSAALFYDAPLNTEKGTALSAYAGYYNLDYGTNYLRFNGIMNPANGVTGSQYISGTQGNAFPMFGTGQVLYTQIGYLLKKDLLGEGNGTLMPYASLMSADFDRLDDNMNVWDVGVNWFIKGHSSKITLDYQNRPTYENQSGDYVKTGNKGQVLLQYQIFF
ncbi:hypothetical protein [Ohtaekwangia koreensis]|uniref:Phosphate-selective porin OprO and OprP n=1 Tax=Ohtaekwangia koreensis TaxID=688867 RepID=A0A1T5J199_9BACT|nr:hypothetical protein [Ohtaekwangia koreensis]SKC45156.1 hypothetical protein SAMN05660236_0639 [Ohtaekwangia koreensis]